MNLYINPSYQEWESLSLRPTSQNEEIKSRVEKILFRVKEKGDNSIRELAYEIDGVELDNLVVTKEEFEEASKLVSDDVKEAIKRAAKNITEFHKAQLPKCIEIESERGVKCIQKPVAINKVGLYVPGGTAPLFSTVLMLSLPAKIAGCKQVVLCTPTNKEGKIAPEVLFAANYCGVNKVYKIGGAQAIAAMAYGTETVLKVDKIFGPGNQYVTIAKQILSTDKVAIDMPAGPSEVMVIADSYSSPRFVAADLLSQAEHGADSQVMLLCTSQKFAIEVEKEIAEQTKELSRVSFINKSLSHSKIVVFDDIEKMVEFADFYAPEHLIINTSNACEIAEQISAAGSVFVGEYTPESAGDYASGTNHTLPTSGWSKSYSGVNIDSFMRKMTLQYISKDGLMQLSNTIITMAEAEGLQAHANAVKIRINEN